MSCAAQPEEGNWVVQGTTEGITRVTIRLNCQDQILNGEPYPPGPPWYVHLWGKCEPTDCDWGEIGATRLSTGQIYAVYDQGFAKRYVYTQITPDGKSLWLYVHTHFTDPGRPDYTLEEWFSPEPANAARAIDAAIRKKMVEKGTRPSGMRSDLDPKAHGLVMVTGSESRPLPAPSPAR